MVDESEQRIRERAYHLWEKEGSPDGRESEFWERARLFVEAERVPPPVRAAPTKEEREIDVAMAETFPASDPPAFTADRGPKR